MMLFHRLLLFLLFLVFVVPIFPQKTVHVREYRRKDGTVVRAHDRRAPGSRSSSTIAVPDETAESGSYDVPIKEIDEISDWKALEEMSGEIPNNPGLIQKVYAAQIARNNNEIKLLIRIDFPWGSPKFPGATYPPGFDTTSIRHILFRVGLNCETLIVKPITGSASVYRFDGKRLDSKEAPVTLESGHVFAEYFCERGEAPKKAPVLKPN